MASTSDDTLIYDPLRVFVDTYSDPHLARDLAPLLTCLEVNVLAGLLEDHDQHDAAADWLSCHQADCDKPDHH